MAVKVATPDGKPHVLMMTMVMPYLRDSLESKFNLLLLWEHSNKDEFLTSVADTVSDTVENTNKLLFSLNRNLEILPWRSKVGGLSCCSLHMETELGVARVVF